MLNEGAVGVKCSTELSSPEEDRADRAYVARRAPLDLGQAKRAVQCERDLTCHGQTTQDQEDGEVLEESSENEAATRVQLRNLQATLK